ncbi:hypothetical protein C4D60_Mb02t14080 [Musa balbisiana]|uniref:LOB domain-containing protein n=1 Tax=Musa balbisiana TaxID=52838 RepID=A0A4S8IAK3_MUSBA|nr:hypothetical protein C4D60_Mb02t14080 [Musa balbisiana]
MSTTNCAQHKQHYMSTNIFDFALLGPYPTILKLQEWFLTRVLKGSWSSGYHPEVGKHRKDDRGREKEQHGFAMRGMQALAATVHTGHRGDAVSSLVYEANARVRDPVYGCVAAISSLHRQIQALQAQLAVAHAQMAHLRTQNAAYLDRVGLGHGQISMGGAGCSTSTGSSSSLSPKHHTLDMVALDQPGSSQPPVW